MTGIAIALWISEFIPIVYGDYILNFGSYEISSTNATRASITYHCIAVVYEYNIPAMPFATLRML